MQQREYDRLFRIVAGGNVNDTLAMLEAVRDRYADVRTEIPGIQDSVDVRKAVAAILTSMIDKLRITTNTSLQQGEEESDL